MYKVAWFNEYLPDEQVIFENIKNIIESTYKSFWYLKIDTPVVEKNEVLLSKWEINKQIYWLYWLVEKDFKEYSLRYDLTVPLVRYIMDHHTNIVFPFKRYQIDKVWRWERQQRWRYKEFYQADIDVIADDFWYDVEIIWVGSLALKRIFDFLGINENLVISVNHRWIFECYKKYFNLLKIDIFDDFLLAIDDYYKKTIEELISLLSKKIDYELAKSIIEKYISWKLEEEVRRNIKEMDEYFVELETLISSIRKFFDIYWINFEVKYDKFIVRWLDYYTWVIFETLYWNMSIFSWGRYSLRWFNWVWWSIWLTRLFDILKNFIRYDYEEKYLICNFWWWELFEKAFYLMKELQKNNIVEIYPRPDSLKKQLKYADKKRYRYVIFLWEDEINRWVYKIKDLKTNAERYNTFNIR